METLFELTFQDQTLNPQVGTFTDASQATGTFILEDGEYYLTNGDTKGFYAYSPVAMQSGVVDDSKVIIEFDLKVVTASVNTHAIIGTYAGVDGSGIPTGAKITLQYNNGDIKMVLGGGATATLIESADVVVDQWYHFRIDCYLAAPLASTYQVKIDGVLITTVTGATTDYELGIISVLGTDLHACGECGIKNITLVTETNMFVGRTALNQAFTDTKGYVDNQVGACVPLAGTSALAGSIVPDTDNAYDFGSSNYGFASFYINKIYLKGSTIFNLADDNFICVGGATDQANGANLVLNGKNRSTSTGEFKLEAGDGTNTRQLIGKPDGTLSWDGDIIPSRTNTTNLGSPSLQWNNAYTRNMLIDNDINIASSVISRTSNSGNLVLRSGAVADGAAVVLFGKDFTDSNLKGSVLISTHNGSNLKRMRIYPSGTWTWDGTACQITSDQRLKQQIAEIDDKLLDAWEDVEPSQFKYNDAVDQKKDKARLHTGYVVQQIDSACKSHGVDISEYGLYCHEEYPQETEEVEVENEDGTKTKERKVIREASEHYSLRYTEVYAVECMYLRRCIARLTARIEQLEKEPEASK